jgi:hypothetical protein
MWELYTGCEVPCGIDSVDLRPDSLLNYAQLRAAYAAAPLLAGEDLAGEMDVADVERRQQAQRERRESLERRRCERAKVRRRRAAERAAERAERARQLLLAEEARSVRYQDRSFRAEFTASMARNLRAAGVPRDRIGALVKAALAKASA